MGLFSNKKKPCPICGNPTPRLLPDGVEGVPICRECEKKKDMPEGVWKNMTLDGFRQYINFYDANQALRDVFKETFSFNCGGWNDYLRLDTEQKLFRLKMGAESLVMDASCLKGFRIMEDDKVLFESSREGLKCYESDTPARAEALEPLIAQFRRQYAQYEHMKEMERIMRENSKDKDAPSSIPYMSRPSFENRIIIQNFTVEMTLEHPYWDGTHSWECKAPELHDQYPSVDDFLNEYQKQVNGLHTLAGHLMSFIDPNAQEVQIFADKAGKESGTGVSAEADPVEMIQRYKSLLDAGIITEEEFTAKKRQLMGI